MPLRGLIHLRLKLLWLWLHIVARRGEAVVSTVTKLPPSSSSQYGFVLIDTHGFVCTRNSHFYLRQWASFQFPEWLFLRRPDSPRVIDFYLRRSTKNTPGHVFHEELKTEVVYSMVWKYKQTHKYTQLCKCDTRPEKCAIYGFRRFLMQKMKKSTVLHVYVHVHMYILCELDWWFSALQCSDQI